MLGIRRRDGLYFPRPHPFDHGPGLAQQRRICLVHVSFGISAINFWNSFYKDKYHAAMTLDARLISSMIGFAIVG